MCANVCVDGSVGVQLLVSYQLPVVVGLPHAVPLVDSVAIHSAHGRSALESVCVCVCVCARVCEYVCPSTFAQAYMFHLQRVLSLRNILVGHMLLVCLFLLLLSNLTANGIGSMRHRLEWS